MPAGRPTEYNPACNDLIMQQARGGATDLELADSLEVTIRTFQRWKAKHKEFRHALKVAKGVANQRVVSALYSRALGFEHDSEKIFCNKDGEVTRVSYREIVPPDTTACIFWLKNREPEQWRDKREVENSGEIGIKSILIPQRISTVPSERIDEPDFE